MKMVYNLTQQLQLTEWLSDTLPVVKESYERIGLLLLEQTFAEGRWRRSIDEYISDKQYLAEIRAKLLVTRDELEEKHIKTTDQRSIEFALESPLQIDSDEDNSDPIVQFTEGTAIPHQYLYLPTIVPSMPTDPLAQGDTWEGAIRLEAKAFEFPVKYTAAIIEQKRDGTVIKVTIDEDQEPSSSGEEVQGFLQPAGQWIVHISKNFGAPTWGEGLCSMRLRMKFRSMEGRDLDVISLSSSNTFRYQSIPVSFDDQNISLTAWHESESSDIEDSPNA